MKIFIDSMPELDGKMNVESYRKMPWSGFYEMIRSSLRDAQSVIKNSNAQTSVTAVAADAMITAILGQNVEAEQLATQALTTAVGNTEAIKALLFLRYREGKDSDVMDLASEKAKDPKESFGLSIVIGKAYYRLGKYAQAAKIFSDAVGKSPDRSDAWALLGEAQLAQGNEKEALAAFSTGLQKNQFNQRAIRGLSRLKKNEHLANPLYKGLLPI
jgi:predicted Zn-dependent protease